jgi:hypothetical protein
MGELLLRVELVAQHVLQLFTLQLSTPTPPKNRGSETESFGAGGAEKQVVTALDLVSNNTFTNRRSVSFQIVPLSWKLHNRAADGILIA